ncbi:MAG TPA: long-chain-fatty-acid--CoA ligase [Mycobacteriales bacterium]|nr:long-chain-fatty-acid--CoA ligase [Mycobacteriales bacterium]
MAELLLAHADADRPAMLFEDQRWTWPEYVAGCAQRAALLADRLPAGAHPHVGVLLDNTPEYAMWLGAAILSGTTVVGINQTRRGDELARDVRHADCAMLVTDSALAPLTAGLDLGVATGQVHVSDSPEYAELLAPYAGAPVPRQDIDPAALLLLLFTSGTSGTPKAVRCTQGRLAGISLAVTQMFALTQDDVCYIAMPMFHSNALMAGWGPSVAAGATAALRRKFSASGFLADVRRFGATYANYVGKPLSYVLATPEQPDDADNPLRRVFGNEGATEDLARFERRFGCVVTDGYGSTEGGASVRRVPDMPAGAFGVLTDGLSVRDQDTGAVCPRAVFDDNGRLLNGDEAVGELVNEQGGAAFEGYWKDEDATAARVREGAYWTGDLVYADADGFLWFAGRTDDWLRVDGENIAAAPIERLLVRHPDVMLAAAYAVPDPVAGDQLMVALWLHDGAAFDPDEFATFLTAQPDLATTWVPRFVRVGELPMTPTGKVLKRQLRTERWETEDVWWRPAKDPHFIPLPADERAKLDITLSRR